MVQAQPVVGEINVEPVLVDVPTACTLAGNISRRKLEQLAKDGRITPKMIDGKVVYPIDEIRRFAQSLPSWEP